MQGAQNRSSKIFPLPSFLLHLFHNQVNFLSNSFTTRAGVELYVPWPVGELISNLLYHLERFKCLLYGFEILDLRSCHNTPSLKLIAHTSLHMGTFQGQKRNKDVNEAALNHPAKLQTPCLIEGTSSYQWFQLKLTLFIFSNVQRKISCCRIAERQ